MASRIEGDRIYTDSITFLQAPNLPSSSVTNDDIEASAGIVATKLEGEYHLSHYQTTGTAVVAAVQDVKIIRGNTGYIVDVEAAVTGAIATGGDRTVTVDLHKSTSEGAFATVLTSTIQFTNASVLRRVYTATINTDDVVDGDILRVVITVAGAAGNQAQGLCVTVTLREDAE